MTDEQAQAIYNDGYAQGKKDAEARSRIGKVYPRIHLQNGARKPQAQ